MWHRRNGVNERLNFDELMITQFIWLTFSEIIAAENSLKFQIGNAYLDSYYSQSRLV